MAQRILVVDDDLYLRDIYNETLTGAGFEVDIAPNGKIAEEKLQQGGYDLILLDIMLPQIDGIGVLQFLTHTETENKNGPVVVLSNLSHETLIKDALAKGAVSFLVKAELTPDLLLGEVRKYLQQEVA